MTSPSLADKKRIARKQEGNDWSVDLNLYSGGRSTVDGVVRDDLLRNSRLGGTFVLPFKRRHAIKTSFSRGVVTKSGDDYDAVSVSYLRILR